MLDAIRIRFTLKFFFLRPWWRLYLHFWQNEHLQTHKFCFCPLLAWVSLKMLRTLRWIGEKKMPHPSFPEGEKNWRSKATMWDEGRKVYLYRGLSSTWKTLKGYVTFYTLHSTSRKNSRGHSFHCCSKVYCISIYRHYSQGQDYQNWATKIAANSYHFLVVIQMFAA